MNTNPNNPTKPIFPSLSESQRADHTGLRKRMLCGMWYDDLLDALNRNISITRQDAWGTPDMSSNIFRETTKTLCALYIRPPTLTNPDSVEGSTTGFLGNDGLLASSGLWAKMKRVQFFTLGLRECFIRIDLAANDTISHRIVTPDNVTAVGFENDQQTPCKIEELRLRLNPNTSNLEWTSDLLDISDPKNPIYKVISKIEKHGKITEIDSTDLYLGGDMSGANYPYIGVNGVPFLPYSLYHAELTGELFDPYYNAELVEGSLTASVLYSYFLHLSRDCAHPQRWIYNAMPAGLATQTNGNPNTAVIESDPASIIVFQSATENGEGNTQAQFGQFAAGGDITKTIESITTYERRLATLAGIKSGDVQKMGGDPRSGYAIAISRSSLREAQAEYTPSFRLADLNTIEITAKLSNIFLGTSYPESGYQIDYYELPKSPEELKAERDERNDKLEQGLLSKIQAVMEMKPDYDRQDAIEYLNQVKRDNAIII